MTWLGTAAEITSIAFWAVPNITNIKIDRARMSMQETYIFINLQLEHPYLNGGASRVSFRQT
jgi:hypothetical protein